MPPRKRARRRVSDEIRQGIAYLVMQKETAGLLAETGGGRSALLCGSEGNRAAEHEAFEVAAVPDIAGEEAVVVLVHPLAFREEVVSHEPAAADLIPVHVHVSRVTRQA